MAIGSGVGDLKAIKNEFINEYHLTTECAICDYCDSLNYVSGPIKYNMLLSFPKKLEKYNIGPTDQNEFNKAIEDINTLQKIKNPTKDQIESIYKKLSEIKNKIIKTKIGFDLNSVLMNNFPIAHLLNSNVENDKAIFLLNSLCKNKDFLNQKNAEKKTPLQLAIELKKANAVEILIRNGANLDGIEINEDIFALGKESVIDLLISKGKFKFSSFEKLVEDRSHSQFKKAIMEDKKPTKQEKAKMKDIINKSFSLEGSPMTPLQYAASQGDLAYIKKLITTHKAKVNEGTPTPLALAFEKSNFNIVRELIMAGAKLPSNISIVKGEDNDTILHYAARFEDELLLKKLLKSPVSENVKKALLQVNTSGDTPLDIACTKNNSSCVKLLVNALPSTEIKEILNRKESNKKMPIELALENRDIDSVKILIKKGANLPPLSDDLKSQEISVYTRTAPQIFLDIFRKGFSAWKNPPTRTIEQLLGIKPQTLELEGSKETKVDVSKASTIQPSPVFTSVDSENKRNLSNDNPVPIYIKTDNAEVLQENLESANKIEPESNTRKSVSLPLFDTKKAVQKTKAVFLSFAIVNKMKIAEILTQLHKDRIEINKSKAQEPEKKLMIMKNELEIEALNKVYNYLNKNPGVTAENDEFSDLVGKTLQNLTKIYDKIGNIASKRGYKLDFLESETKKFLKKYSKAEQTNQQMYLHAFELNIISVVKPYRERIGGKSYDK